MDLQLNGKLALVTGSTAGIGRAIAERLAREGATVIVNGRTQKAVDEAVEQIGAATGGKAIGFTGDLSTAEAAEALAAEHPGVEILINNLGIFEVVPFLDISDDEWRRFFEVNVLSGVRLSRLYLPAMQKANWGRIVFISSESALQIPVEMVHYGMTKTAQIAVARGLAQVCAGTGITVNSVLPGPTMTAGVEEMLRQNAGGKSMEEAERAFFETARPTSLIKRFADPAEVASLVAYVASPLASATTGAALRVEGGVVLSAF